MNEGNLKHELMYAYQCYGGERWVRSRVMEGGGGRRYVRNDGGAGLKGKQEGEGEGRGREVG